MAASTPTHLANLPTTNPGPERSLPTSFVVASLAVAGLVAFLNGFSSPFLFDDYDSINQNASLRHLWPIWDALTPGGAVGAGVTNRPIVNLSLALNYAVGGLHVEGYHIFNFVIHLLASLLLYGVVRRTLLQPAARNAFGKAAGSLAWVSALCWLLHPLQTESVTCVIQRTESLMGLIFLGTFYAAIRAMESVRPTRWYLAAIVGCLAGMATKEVMVSAPLLIFLYDRTFVAGSFRAAWERRKGFYLSLAATWALLAWLVIDVGGGTRGGSCGLAGLFRGGSMR